MGHSGRMRRSTAVTTSAWVAGATLATAGVTVALSLLGHQLLGSAGPVLSSAQVRASLAAQGPASPPATPRPGRYPSGPPGPWAARTFTGGTVFAACLQHRATLTDWIPAQGYRTAGFSPGPAAAVSVRFESATAAQVVTVTCPRGRPVFLSSRPPALPSATPAAPPPAARSTAPAGPGEGGKGKGTGGPGGSGGGHGGDG
jgi:hypothetical protein